MTILNRSRYAVYFPFSPAERTTNLPLSYNCGSC